jgi:hypothetical protein
MREKNLSFDIGTSSSHPGSLSPESTYDGDDEQSDLGYTHDTSRKSDFERENSSPPEDPPTPPSYEEAYGNVSMSPGYWHGGEVTGPSYHGDPVYDLFRPLTPAGFPDDSVASDGTHRFPASSPARTRSSSLSSRVPAIGARGSVNPSSSNIPGGISEASTVRLGPGPSEVSEDQQPIPSSIVSSSPDSHPQYIPASPFMMPSSPPLMRSSDIGELSDTEELVNDENAPPPKAPSDSDRYQGRKRDASRSAESGREASSSSFPGQTSPSDGPSSPTPFRRSGSTAARQRVWTKRQRL